MANTPIENKIKDRPFKPSWIDRFTDWVDRLPLQIWILYLGLGLVLIVFQLIPLWVEDTSQIEVLISVIVFNSMAIPYVLALIHYLDNEAITALEVMKPAIKLSDREFNLLLYKISTMPFLPSLMSGLATLIIMILIEQLWYVPVRYEAFAQLPVLSIIYQAIDKIGVFIAGTFIYHTVHQLGLVDRIFTKHAHIYLFNVKPLYAFSKLTALTTVGLVIGFYGWGFINPDLLTDPISIGIMIFISILAMATFVWPLYGAHRLMEKEKEKLLIELDFRFESAFNMFNQRFDNNDFSGIERVNGIISSLESQHKKIGDIPTWPWRPDMVRFTLTAIAIPLILMILQFFVEQTLGL
jgi:hypothetical protein